MKELTVAIQDEYEGKVVYKTELYTEEEYKKLEERVKFLEEENNNLKNELMEDMKTETELNEEIRNLKSDLSKFRDSFKKYRDYEKEELAESCYDFARENEKLKADYIKLSKIVETTGGYKASYVNELRDKIAKLEFNIEAWKKLKAVREEKERMLNEKIGKLVMKS